MYNTIPLAEDLFYVGASNRRLSLFEGAYPVPRGVSYNSYLLIDGKTVLFDTADASVEDLFLENVERALGGRELDYLVVHHAEPDHSACVRRILERYPSAVVLASAKAIQMLKNFCGELPARSVAVKEGDTVSVGKYTLQFISAPMIHWPEVMFTYIPEREMLFTADAFGTFGALDGSVFADELHFERDFLSEARRYYFNIVGKYGAQVQSALKKLSDKPLSLVCPLHGPVWRSGFSSYLETYGKWSAYLPEERGVVIFYASVYGHTKNAAELLASALAAEGVREVRTYDVSVTHGSELLAEAFRYSHAVFASVTLNAGIFPAMEQLINELKAHNFQNRKYAIIENGSWAPQAGALIEAQLSALKNTEKVGETVKMVSALSEQGAADLRVLAKNIADDVCGKI